MRSPVLENSGITYLHIHEDATLSLGIFLLPAGTRIPLHNHPGMTVLSRVLYGQLHVTSYDWRDHASDSDPGTPRAAVPVLDVVQGSNDVPVVLFPTFGGNIHQFDAVTDCAVLDLLSPPYSTDDGRDCTYYRVTTTTGNGQEKVAWLQEYDPPRSFAISECMPAILSQASFLGVAAATRAAICGGTSVAFTSMCKCDASIF